MVVLRVKPIDLNLLKRKSYRLVDGCRRGDQAAMYRLYAGHVDAVYNSCIRLVGVRQDAEEIVQDTFAQAFATIGQLRDDDAFPGWLRRIVINKALNHLRKQPSFLTDQVDFPDDVSCEEDADVWDGITPEKVAEAVSSLPERARVVFSLYQIEGYKHREIAARLEISESTSKSQYARACMLLRQKLLQECPVNS